MSHSLSTGMPAAFILSRNSSSHSLVGVGLRPSEFQGLTWRRMPVVVGQVPRRAQEDPAHVHQLAEREVGEQHADEEEVDEERRARRPRGTTGCRVTRPEGQLLDRHEVDLREVAHEDAGRGHARAAGRGRSSRRAARCSAPAGSTRRRRSRRNEQRRHDQHVASGRAPAPRAGRSRRGCSRSADDAGHRLEEEAQVAQEDDQEAPVEGQRRRPEALVRAVDDAAARASARPACCGTASGRAAPRGPSAPPPTPGGRRALEAAGLDPGQGLLLAAGRR